MLCEAFFGIFKIHCQSNPAATRAHRRAAVGVCKHRSLSLTCARACRLEESLSADLAAVATAPAYRPCDRPCDSSVVIFVLQHSARALTSTPDSV